MKTDIFPLNYFKSIWTPIQAFKNRFKLNWFNMVLVIIFLNALMVIPVTMNYTQLDSFPLEGFYPNAVQVLDEQGVNELQQAQYHEGDMLISEPFLVENEEGLLAGGMSFGEMEDRINEAPFILFEENQFRIGEEDAPIATVLYTRDFSLESAGSQEDVVDELSRQWFNQNRVFIVLIFSALIGLFLLFMTTLLVLGSAFILYLTRKGRVTTIETFKESVNLILNGLAVPTLAAMLFGLFYFDIYLMVTIQTLGLAVYLFVIFYKIQFNDHKLEAMELEM